MWLNSAISFGISGNVSEAVKIQDIYPKPNEIENIFCWKKSPKWECKLCFYSHSGTLKIINVF